MRFLNKLQLLFLSIIFLLGVIIAFEFFNAYVPYRLYCGGAIGNYVPTYNSDTIKSIHEAAEQLFKENCKSCHKIHEDAVGPALHGVTERRPRKWIYSFIQNSQKLIDDEDTMAINLYNKYNKCQMTSFPTLTEAEIDSILLYIEEFKPIL